MLLTHLGLYSLELDFITCLYRARTLSRLSRLPRLPRLPPISGLAFRHMPAKQQQEYSSSLVDILISTLTPFFRHGLSYTFGCCFLLISSLIPIAQYFHELILSAFFLPSYVCLTLMFS